jgi:hypothetical protein
MRMSTYGFLVAERSRFPPLPGSAILDYQRPNSRPASGPAARVRAAGEKRHRSATRKP